MSKSFDEIFNRNDNPAVTLRREFHRFPETGFLVYRTASLTADYLEKMGFDVRVGPEVMDKSEIIDPPSVAAVEQAKAEALQAGGIAKWMDKMPDGQTGIVATKTFGDGPVLAFRFEMDALPVEETLAQDHEPNEGGYRSCREGFMHACGHDGHNGIGLAVAARLAQMKNLKGTIKFIFQPAEEIAQGAKPMVAAGVVDDVDYFFCQHLGCFLPSGSLAADTIGFLVASRWKAVFTGVGAHAAMGPQEGKNALMAGATATLNINAIARFTGSQTFVNVGQLSAGKGYNVIPEHCEMLLEVRAENREAHDFMAGRVHEILNGAALMHGVKLTLEPKTHMPGNQNSPEAVAMVTKVAHTISALKEILPEWSIGGGDDASLMIQRVRERGGYGCYFMIGSDIPAVHHADNFDIDESSLEIGIEMFLGLAREVLGCP